MGVLHCRSDCRSGEIEPDTLAWNHLLLSGSTSMNSKEGQAAKGLGIALEPSLVSRRLMGRADGLVRTIDFGL